MINNIIQELIQNIVIRINFLQQDYIGPKLDFSFLIYLIQGFIFTFILLFCSYFIGQLIRKHLLSINVLNINTLIDIALGYLLIGTGIAILGFFSLLNSFSISIYVLLVLLLSSYLFRKQKRNISKYLKDIRIYLNRIRENKFVLMWTFVFVFVAFVNLINPEIREDQYHVDFPKIYLNEKTIMVPPMEQLHVSAAPLLSEMTYLIGIFIFSNESARYVHFVFYLATLLTLFSISLNNKYKFSSYAPLLFASAPVVIHETSSMYVDFQWIIMFLLTIYLISYIKKFTKKELVLVGLLIGGMVSIKLWTIVFIPLLTFFITWKIFSLNKSFLKKFLTLLFSIILFPTIWFVRSFILTGNPFYPAFSSIINLENTKEYYGLFHYIGINSSLINPKTLINVFSPLFFLGILLFFYKLSKNLTFIKNDLFKFTGAILLLYLSIQYPFGRYLLGLYIALIFFSSIGLFTFEKYFKYSKHLISILLIILSSYYLINSVLILPYTIGIADKNKYLTRILSKDNSSYYDFDRKFDKHIDKLDRVATYKIFGYYYAKFNFLDVNFIFNKNNLTFNTLTDKRFKYVFTKDYTIDDMCKNLKIKKCNPDLYVLISSYNKYPNYYLYRLK